MDNIKNDKHRKELTRFRISAHELAIETDRYIGQERRERLCSLCKNKMSQNIIFF